MATPKDIDPALTDFFAARDDAARAVAATRALEALVAERKGARGPSAPDPPSWPGEIRAHYFRPRRGTAYVNDPVDIAKLPHGVRRILELLCEMSDLDAVHYAHAGLPPDVRSRRRLLGLEPPTVMEDRIPSAALGPGKHPRWKVLAHALDKYGRTYIGKDKPKPPTQAWIAKSFFDLTPAQWLELWTEVKARSYGIITAWGGPFDPALAAVSKAERLTWAKRWTEEIAATPDPHLRDYVGPSIVKSFVAAKEPVPARLADLMKAKPAKAPKKKKKAPEPPKPRPGKYVFFGKRSYELADAEALSAKEKKQFMVAVRKYVGKELRSPKAFFTHEAKEQETTIDGVDLVKWQIAMAPQKKKAVFELWVFLVDNGTVFPVGSAEPSGVVMMQGGFLVEDKKPATKELAAELQANVPF